jgi:hypothetical protein
MATASLSLVPKRSLFAHVAEVESIADLVDRLDRTNELTPEAAEQLSAALIEAIAGTKQKTDRTCAVLAAFEAAGTAAKAERDRLDVRVKYFERQAERLEAYCLAVLSASNLDRIDGMTASISRRKNPGKVIVDSPAAVPWDFMRLPEPKPEPVAEPDKKLIAQALKNGVPVSGCRFIQDFRLVRS